MDDGQTVTDVVEYSPYGLITHRTGDTDTPFLYNGMFGVMTSGNGLLYMRARFYNPYTRRFINADPIGFAGGMNWYQYAAGNPISFGDPSGNSPALLLIPLIWWGSTQTANAPGPEDRTTNDTPFVAPAMLASGVGPTVTAGRTIVGSSMTAGRGFMNTLTGPATNVTQAGFGIAEASAGMSLLVQAGTQVTSHASRQFAAKALTYYGTYSAASFTTGAVIGSMTPTDGSSLTLSGNPLTMPFEVGGMTGGFLGNAVDYFSNRPPSGGNNPKGVR